MATHECTGREGRLFRWGQGFKFLVANARVHWGEEALFCWGQGTNLLVANEQSALGERALFRWGQGSNFLVANARVHWGGEPPLFINFVGGKLKFRGSWLRTTPLRIALGTRLSNTSVGTNARRGALGHPLSPRGCRRTLPPTDPPVSRVQRLGRRGRTGSGPPWFQRTPPGGPPPQVRSAEHRGGGSRSRLEFFVGAAFLEVPRLAEESRG